jgi:hypothetical protein
MSWLGDLWKKIKGAEADDLVLVSSLAVPGQTPEDIEADNCYIELYVESLKIQSARRFATQFQGVVYSFVTLARDGEANAQLAAVSKPAKLATLDSTALNKVITVSKQMMGAVPWRGGALAIELGLFSVKTGNLLTPIIDLVTDVSTAAGIGFVGQVKPFLPLISKGMDLIAGQTNDTALEVAVDTSLNLTKTGNYAIIAAPKAELAGKTFSIDPSDHKLLCDGKSLDKAYCVFSIRRSLQKADFGEIPDLKERYAALQAAIRSNDVKRARDELTSFRLATLTSPDLIPADAKRLAAKADQRVKDAFPAGGIAESLTRKTGEEPLSGIGLYE